MTYINVDTDKMRDFSKDILEAVDSYKNNINTLFYRMENVPVKTREWVGIAAERYVERIKKEKQNYIEYGNNLEKMGLYLSDYVDDLEKAIRNTKID